MSTEMTSRDRMLAAIRREEHDHVPFSLHCGQGPWFPEPFFWRDQVQRAEKLLAMGLDPTIDIWLPDPMMSDEVEVKTWREKKGEEWILTKEFHTPAGVLRQVVRETRDWCEPDHGPWIPTTWGFENREDFNMALFDDHAVSRRLEPWVKGREDLAKLRYIIRPLAGWQLDEWFMDQQRAMEVAKKLGVMTHVRRTIVSDANEWMCDIPWFMVQLYEDPEFIIQFLDIFMEWSRRQIEFALEVGADVVQYRGWYDIPNFWGPKFWRKHILPIVREHADLIHGGGKHMSYLLTEGQGQYTKELKESGVDVLYYVDPRMVKGKGLEGLRDELGDVMSFWGGVNNEVTLRSCNAERIEAEVKKSIEILGAKNGLILSAGAGMHTRVEAIQYMIDAWRKFNGTRQG